VTAIRVTGPRVSQQGSMQIAHRRLDKPGSPPGAGALFGLALKPRHRGIYYVDDAVNTLRLLH
jgi:hypothetical protein